MNDCIVIGAGFSGLASAAALRRAGRSFLVLEARDRIGGRTVTRALGEGRALDWGGQWIGPGQTRIYRLASELGVPVFPTHDEGRHFFSDRSGIEAFEGLLPGLDGETKRELEGAMADLEKMAEDVDPVSPWESARAREWDARTLREWLDHRLKSSPANRTLASALRLLTSTEAEKISLLFALVFIRSGRGLAGLLSVSGGAQQDRFVDGTADLARKLSESFADLIRFNTPVVAIEQTESGVTIATEHENFFARRVIVALAPRLADEIDYRPSLPDDRTRLMAGSGMGSVVKCMGVYPTPFWREAGYSGQAFSTEGLLTSICDNTPARGFPGVLVGFVVGAEADRLRRHSPSERREIVLGEFGKWFGARATAPSHYDDLSWADEPRSRGGFFGILAPGILSEYGPALRRPEGRIHWAGTETAREWMGFIEGALESGARAAAEVVAAEATTEVGP